MSKAFYMRHTHLYKYPKFHSTIRNLQVGNGEPVAVLFVIPFVFKVGKHMFEIYTLVSERKLGNYENKNSGQPHCHGNNK